jgi:heptose-I-phosphate ethanolaminephosphotransferase
MKSKLQYPAKMPGFIAIIRKILQFLTEPVVAHYTLFVYLIALQSLAAFLLIFLYTDGFTLYDRIYLMRMVVFMNLLMAYLVTWIDGYLPKGKWQRGFMALFVGIAGLFQLLHLFCLFSLHDVFSKDIFGAVIATNPSEAKEFFGAYLSGMEWAAIAGCVLFFVGITYAAVRFRHTNVGILRSVGHRILLLVVLGVSGHEVYMKCDSFIRRQSVPGVVDIFLAYEPITELPRTCPALDTSSRTDLPKIVVIVGESLNKNHCSLYGYPKQTNPRLAAIPDSLLHVFAHVEAPATVTISAFAQFMTASGSQDVQTCHKEPNLINIAGAAGYRRTWISNQSRRGFYDNGVAKYAQLCDTVFWNGDQYVGMYRDCLDSELIPVVRSFHTQEAPHSMTWIHLMGSHEMYRKRYSADFDRFKPADYADAPENQRGLLAEYDNSVLFNDAVVADLIQMYAEEDAVVIYFSDHALDLFDSSPTFNGHARPNDERSVYYGRQIPFMIYTSPSFRVKYPALVKGIESSQETSFNTTDFPYLVMQLLGVSFTDLPNKYPLGQGLDCSDKLPL